MIDAFLEELKERQELRGQILEAKREGKEIPGHLVDSGEGGRPTRDPPPLPVCPRPMPCPACLGVRADLFAGDREEESATTNLCITHLASEINEEALMREFGRFGPLASVKVSVDAPGRLPPCPGPTNLALLPARSCGPGRMRTGPGATTPPSSPSCGGRTQRGPWGRFRGRCSPTSSCG